MKFIPLSLSFIHFHFNEKSTWMKSNWPWSKKKPNKRTWHYSVFFFPSTFFFPNRSTMNIICSNTEQKIFTHWNFFKTYITSSECILVYAYIFISVSIVFLVLYFYAVILLDSVFFSKIKNNFFFLKYFFAPSYISFLAMNGATGKKLKTGIELRIDMVPVVIFIHCTWNFWLHWIFFFHFFFFSTCSGQSTGSFGERQQRGYWISFSKLN